MRIIAGRFGSRVLKGPGRLTLRPTSDRLRQCLFDILGAGVEGATFIDAFAGTGAVGLEALSRGAQRVIFIEISRRAVALIGANLAQLGVGAQAEVIHGDALRALRRLAEQHVRAQFLFLDPPYRDAPHYRTLLASLAPELPLAPEGLLIVEHPARLSLPAFVGPLERTRTATQGDAALSFYRWMPGG